MTNIASGILSVNTKAPNFWEIHKPMTTTRTFLIEEASLVQQTIFPVIFTTINHNLKATSLLIRMQ